MNGKIMVFLSGAICLLSCSAAEQEVQWQDIWDFRVAANGTEVEIGGLLGNSAMGVSGIKTRFDRQSGELNFLLLQKPAGRRYSGRISEKIPVPYPPVKITYGKAAQTVWQRPSEKAAKPLSDGL
ncbi:hypothetical protein ACG2K1_08795 [Neisseria sp. 23W00296]|uniref:hypothetical protein n=1 Tax=unclassified Neisseria TaxID=2623750 RepID=UPI0002A3D35F|nr:MULTISPECIES: hypothetical protein [unclassified Neisseria]ASP16916.1 hypothetical protein CGZ77_03635 [Neisseria sp. KEM232]EKY03727.1 hypothetical protein HMPREF9120_02589 [Neisseria sp. oral taxon 020 str. F0370]